MTEWEDPALIRLTLFETAGCATGPKLHNPSPAAPPHAFRNRGVRDRIFERSWLTPENRLTLFETAGCATLTRGDEATAIQIRLTLFETAGCATLSRKPGADPSSPPHAFRNRGVRDGDRPRVLLNASIPPHAFRNRGVRDVKPVARKRSPAIRLTLFETAGCATGNEGSDARRARSASRFSKPRGARLDSTLKPTLQAEHPPHAFRNRGVRDTTSPKRSRRVPARLTLFETAGCATPGQETPWRKAGSPPHAFRNRGVRDRPFTYAEHRQNPPHAFRNRGVRDLRVGRDGHVDVAPPHAFRNRGVRDGVRGRHRPGPAGPPHAFRNRGVRDLETLPLLHPQSAARLTLFETAGCATDGYRRFHTAYIDRLTLFETAGCATWGANDVFLRDGRLTLFETAGCATSRAWQ